MIDAEMTMLNCLNCIETMYQNEKKIFEGQNNEFKSVILKFKNSMK